MEIDENFFYENYIYYEKVTIQFFEKLNRNWL